MIFSAAMVSSCKHLRAAAIVGQRHQRAQRRQVAHVGAEIAFQSPERRDHFRRHAVLLFRARKRCRVGLDAGLALLHAGDRRHPPREHREHLAEHALAAVAVDDALVVDEIRRGFRQRGLRDAGGDGLLFQAGQKLIKTLAAMTGRAARAWRRNALLGWRQSRPRRRYRRSRDSRSDGSGSRLSRRWHRTKQRSPTRLCRQKIVR